MKLVADANVLLSAVIGGRAKGALVHPRVEQVLVAEATFGEVEEYAPILAARKGLWIESVLAAVASLPVTIVPSSVYESKLREATRRIAHRDPDDLDILALALHTRLPIWSNDMISRRSV